jgi:hypothetical protein
MSTIIFTLIRRVGCLNDGLGNHPLILSEREGCPGGQLIVWIRENFHGHQSGLLRYPQRFHLALSEESS